MKSLAVAERYGFARYVANQAYYSLIGRDYEWELMPLGLDQGVGAAGVEPARLGPPHRQDPPRKAAARRRAACMRRPAVGPPVADEYVYKVVDALDEIAAETGKSIPQIALNWLLQRPTVSTRAVVGARNEAATPRQNLGCRGLEPHRRAGGGGSTRASTAHGALPALPVRGAKRASPASARR